MQDEGFRRRILIETKPGRATAELEDDYHRMLVRIEHVDGMINNVHAVMKRAPWTSCPGALVQLHDTFVGKPLGDRSLRHQKSHNCTHLFDLAELAAGHAQESEPTAYDVFVSDPCRDSRIAVLERNGEETLRWILKANTFLFPSVIAGRSLYEIGDWITTLIPQMQEEARILRWASMIANGRQMDIPAGSSADRFPLGTCFTFQQGVASTARRLPDAALNFAPTEAPPLADRPAAFHFDGND